MKKFILNCRVGFFTAAFICAIVFFVSCNPLSPPPTDSPTHFANASNKATMSGPLSPALNIGGNVDNLTLNPAPPASQPSPQPPQTSFNASNNTGAISTGAGNATSNISDNHSVSQSVSGNISGPVVLQANSPNSTVTVTTNIVWEVSEKQSDMFLKLPQNSLQNNGQKIKVGYILETTSQASSKFATDLMKLLNSAGYDTQGQIGSFMPADLHYPIGILITLPRETQTLPKSVAQLVMNLNTIGISTAYTASGHDFPPSSNESAIVLIVGDKPQ